MMEGQCINLSIYVCRYDDHTRAAIGKYATFHGVAPASCFFTRKLKHRVSETTVRSIRNAYDEMVKKRPHGDSQEDSQEDSDDEKLPLKKRGRPLLLGDSLDLKLQQYVLKVREGGGGVSSTLVMAAAKGLMLPNKQLLKEFGGHMSFSKMWAPKFSKTHGICSEEGYYIKEQVYSGEFF